MQAQSWAKLRVVNDAIMPAIMMETMIPGPAIPATMPVTTKIPAPIIAPTLMAVASNSPNARFSSGSEFLELVTSIILGQAIQYI
jgi:hypothetical protein